MVEHLEAGEDQAVDVAHSADAARPLKAAAGFSMAAALAACGGPGMTYLRNMGFMK
ncbi:hypothetical protein VLK31_12095 [Variovorax sp. H27-G14]|uniref:hypothetical protein n=1 Tax=Variovorax sp. H27-G14 TaxID=3111914 RepID=UPI0038FD1C4A